ncbi:MAG: SOS-response transcriptional repressor [Rhodospirillaceae bacterium]|nr:MAG: SOS-response transcriptional repressor [Rhodospirillaceae bacterium]
MSIGERVKKLRLERGFSQNVLAEACGCTQSNIANLENGRTGLPRYIRELAKVLEVSPEWLQTGEGETLSESFLGEVRKYQQINIGIRLRDTREALGLSKDAICRKLGVDIETWKEWEAGTSKPDVDAIIQWGKFDGVTLDWIYRGIGHSLPYSVVEMLTDLDLRRRGIKKS